MTPLYRLQLIPPKNSFPVGSAGLVRSWLWSVRTLGTVLGRTWFVFILYRAFVRTCITPQRQLLVAILTLILLFPWAIR